ncbi:hypothetical protein AOCH_005130 [Aspergillus ochraceoroseus]|uniref:CST complex subunit Stn1 N-terminal domain-containing protein n=1 Tax=Aspergillus ochraceoroseus TaxID=138278 RepID=A0A0F8VDN9_9EURO|nr:hypothetical protein AOCH_005130 [Aspergillus ochraceoroseus]
MATSSEASQLTFYPAFCFKASPTHFTWKKNPDQGLFFYLNHPIRFVSVMGIIVARTEVPRRTILTLDDSSGATIDIVVLRAEESESQRGTSPSLKSEPELDGLHPVQRQPQPHLTATTQTALSIEALAVGAPVHIKGTLSVFRSTVQIQLERFFPVRETGAEMRFLDQRCRFLVEVLSVPWWVGEAEMARLREMVDEEGRKVEGDQERRARRARRRAEREERDRGRIWGIWEREEAQREREAERCREDGVALMRELEGAKFGC